jgi:WD40 repeat protein
VWNLETGKEIQTLTGHVEAALSVAISPEGDFIASGTRNDVIKLWEMP